MCFSDFVPIFNVHTLVFFLNVRCGIGAGAAQLKFGRLFMYVGMVLEFAWDGLDGMVVTSDFKNAVGAKIRYIILKIHQNMSVKHGRCDYSMIASSWLKTIAKLDAHEISLKPI